MREHPPRDDGKGDALLPLVYDELRRLARRYLDREHAGHTLQPTALVHEAYLRLAEQTRVEWQGRTHFFAMGARMMRRVLVDHARHHARDKRGAGERPVTLIEDVAARALDLADVLALEEVLAQLEAEDEREARVVEMRVFAGLTVAEIAEVLGVSTRTVEGDWTHARAWLAARLAGSSPGAEPR